MNASKARNRLVWLVNLSGQYTLHKFERIDREVANVIDELATGERKPRAVTGDAVIYKCTETGEERRWGFE